MTIATTTTYWDCKCRKNYIHHKTLNRCSLCDATRLESPDSRVDEVRKYLTEHHIEKEAEKPPPSPRYVGVAVDIYHNGGRHKSTQIVPQEAPYYNPTEALEKVLPYIRMLHDVVSINFRQAYE